MAVVHAIGKGWLRMRLTETAGQAVAVYPAFRRVLHLTASAAQFLSQAVYWTEKTDDGWFYKTEREWDDEIALSPKEVRTARKRLEELRLLEEVRKGVPAKMYYRINTELLLAYLDGSIEVPERAQKKQLDQTKGNNQSLPKGTTGSTQKAQQVRTKGKRKSSPNGTTITKTTQKPTAETTAEILPMVAGATNGEPQSNTAPKVEIPSDMPGPKDPSCKTYKAWANYAFAYRRRYSAWPVWNAKAGGQLGQLIDRLGAEAAPQVAAFYVGVNDARLINDCHSLNGLLARAESLHTQWLTGRQMNGRTARQLEDTQANINAAQDAASRIQGGAIDANPFL